jgi:hypothetical protein
VALVRWEAVGAEERVEVESRLSVPNLGGFIGLDREILIESDAPEVAKLERRRVQVTLPLKAEAAVTQLPSDAVIKRRDGYFVLAQTADSKEWKKVHVIKRDAEVAFVSGLDRDAKILRLQLDLNILEKIVAADKEAKKQRVKSKLNIETGED